MIYSIFGRYCKLTEFIRSAYKQEAENWSQDSLHVSPMEAILGEEFKDVQVLAMFHFATRWTYSNSNYPSPIDDMIFDFCCNEKKNPPPPCVRPCSQSWPFLCVTIDLFSFCHCLSLHFKSNLNITICECTLHKYWQDMCVFLVN